MHFSRYRHQQRLHTDPTPPSHSFEPLCPYVHSGSKSRQKPNRALRLQTSPTGSAMLAKMCNRTRSEPTSWPGNQVHQRIMRPHCSRRNPLPGYRVHGLCAAPVSELGAHGEEARKRRLEHSGPSSFWTLASQAPRDEGYGRLSRCRANSTSGWTRRGRSCRNCPSACRDRCRCCRRLRRPSPSCRG